MGGAYATPLSLVGSVSAGISSDVTPDGDHVFILDVKQVDLLVAIGIKMNPRKW